MCCVGDVWSETGDIGFGESRYCPKTDLLDEEIDVLYFLTRGILEEKHMIKKQYIFPACKK